MKNISPEKTTSSILKKYREKHYPGRGGAAICAKEMGIHPQQWRDWESGKVPPSAVNLKKIADFLGITVPELRGESIPNTDTVYDAQQDNGPRIPGLDAGSLVDIEMPEYGEVAAVTSGQDEFHGEVAPGAVTIPAGTGLLKVKGMSMEPLARDGQRVFLRPPLPPGEEPAKGDLVVVWTHERGTVRRLFKRWGGWVVRTPGQASGDDKLILVSVNPVDSVDVMEHIRRDELAGYRVVAGVWYG